jgi:hypothetical protein
MTGHSACFQQNSLTVPTKTLQKTSQLKPVIDRKLLVEPIYSKPQEMHNMLIPYLKFHTILQ